MSLLVRHRFQNGRREKIAHWILIDASFCNPSVWFEFCHFRTQESGISSHSQCESNTSDGSKSDKHSYTSYNPLHIGPLKSKCTICVRGTTHSKQSAHEKNGKRMLMNGVLKKPRKALKETNALGFSIRTTFAQQIESAVTYSAPSNNVNERVWFYFSSLNSGAGDVVLNAHPNAFYHIYFFFCLVQNGRRKKPFS